VQAGLRHTIEETGRDAVIDCPPGASCPAVTAIGPADVVLLVTEPTPFGLHDLKRVRHAFADLGKPMAVVINRAGSGDRRVFDYCRVSGLPVLAEIPFEADIASAADAPAQARALISRHGQAVAAIAAGLSRLAVDGSRGQEAVHA
ncbi:MAG: hypothetical protein MI741_07800, partial [Rhodospirillales bacterium]|nr:hypothetical protein [Rhodospirillales bacterium]